MHIVLKRTIFLWLFSVFFFHLSTVFGQTLTNPDSALQDILATIQGEPLTLNQAIEHSLNNTVAVRQAEASLLAARGAVRRDRGFYDPVLFFDLNYSDQESPTASFFAGSPTLITRQTTTRSGLRMNLPVGTELELAVNTSSLKTNSQFAFLNPEYTTFGSIRLRQPLLGGFAASARKQLSNSERQLEAAKARYDQELLTTSSEVERFYWDLYASERDYAVQILSRNRAAAFLKEAELRAASGLVGPNQVANAKTFLAEQELGVLQMEEQLGRISDGIASLIGVRPVMGGPRFIAVDTPPGEFSVGSLDELIEEAQKNNLSLRAAQNDIEAVRALADAAKWEALPRVDLVGDIGGSGLAGSAQPVVFGTDTLRIAADREGGFGDALQQLSKRKYPNWSVGVQITIPIGFRSGLGEKDRLYADVLNQEQRYIEVLRQLEADIRDTYRILTNGRARLTAARQGVEAAQEQVRIGLIEFKDGQVTAFELVRLGEDFAIAQRRYSEALVLTAKAAATLRQLTSNKNSVKNNNE